MRSSNLTPALLALTLVTACTVSDSPTAPLGSYAVSEATASVAANQPPTASFTWSCTDRSCDFTNTSTDADGVVVSSFWSFGDGWTANGFSPNHTYSDYGVYTVTLTVTDDDRATGTFSTDVAVDPPAQPPTASFTPSCIDLGCDFTDTSTEGAEAIASWSWNFGDGTISTARHPSHAYSAAGVYTVTLTVADGSGRSDTTFLDVTVSEPNQAPTASFTASCTDLSCAFTDTSTDSDGTVVSWMWSFGDGAAATDQSPTHAYAGPGTYTVTLTVTDDDGAGDTKAEVVTVSEPTVVIMLTAVGYWVEGHKMVDLTWSGATSDEVDVYRNDWLTGTIPNDGSDKHELNTRRGGTYRYRVCEAGTSVCSEVVTLMF